MEETRGDGRIWVKKSQPIMVHPRSCASATPLRGEFYYLSNLDQNVASIIQTVYTFGPCKENGEVTAAGEVIREALGRVLVHFYPFCGTLTQAPDGKLVVKCANNGVPFVEAAADCSIAALGDISMPRPEVVGQLVHTDSEANNILETPLLTAQVTKFSCGGFVFGMAVNHCMVDGISAMEFVNCWAETARGVPLTVPPLVDRTILRPRQPPRTPHRHDEFTEIQDISGISRLYEDGEVVYRSFRFDTETMAKLKGMAAEGGAMGSCSSFTALTAFVWRARSAALGMRPEQRTKLLFAVDGRSRLEPPLPGGYFGNGIVLTCCLCAAGELSRRPLSFAAEQVRDAIGRVTDGFIRSAIDHIVASRAKPSLTATLLITSWTRLAFIATDFGWGRPAQFGCVAPPEREVALFYPEKNTTTLLLGLPAAAMDTFQEIVSGVR